MQSALSSFKIELDKKLGDLLYSVLSFFYIFLFSVFCFSVCSPVIMGGCAWAEPSITTEGRDLCGLRRD